MIAAILPWSARADPLSAELVVSRELGAEKCPDQLKLVERVVQLGSPAPAREPLSVEVTFSRGLDEYTALVISRGRKTGLRRLHAGGPDCEALAAAVTVTLAVLLDVIAPDAVASLQPPKPLPPEPQPALEPQPRRPSFENTALVGKLGTGVGYGLLGAAWSPLFAAGFGAQRAHASLAAEAFILLPRERSFAAGYASLWTAGARIEGCAWSGRIQQTRAGFCPGLSLGALRGHGERYDVERTSWQAAWSAVLAAAAVIPVTTQVALRSRISIWVPLLENRFRVDGLGIAYRTQTVGILFELGSEFRFR